MKDLLVIYDFYDLTQGPFNNYVDSCYVFFDHLPTPRRQFIYQDLFTNIDIWLTTHPPPPIYVVFKCPLSKNKFAL